eukprot:CAMPEP_0170181924 /NCGR_PEP_ID=MMETSP0040_2-20121228/26405_1 /TAXON_ID=641309 /ORGANISM="Lotharella oceanica, Strain CCMP622" /LENGTH=356 /DNA_ID=CAMNT_0010427135 /DNA_START=36 /DNA_END=1106 /DNA_ORIENTATION=+
MTNGNSDLFGDLSTSSNQVPGNYKSEMGEDAMVSHQGNQGSMYQSGMGYGAGPMDMPGFANPVMQGGQMLMQTINAPMYFMGRMSQLLGMSFQSLHMSFASFVRLASMALMLKNEVSGAFKTIYEFVLRRLKRMFSTKEQNKYAAAWNEGKRRPSNNTSSWLLTCLALGASVLILKGMYSLIFHSKTQEKAKEEAIAKLTKDKDLVRALTHREVIHMVSEVMQRRKPQSSNEFAVGLLQKCTKPLQKLARSPQLLQALGTPAVHQALTDIGAGRNPEMTSRTTSWIIRCADLKNDAKSPEESQNQMNSNQMAMSNGYGLGGMGYGMGGMGMGLGMGGYGGYGMGMGMGMGYGGYGY